MIEREVHVPEANENTGLALDVLKKLDRMSSAQIKEMGADAIAEIVIYERTLPPARRRDIKKTNR